MGEQLGKLVSLNVALPVAVMHGSKEIQTGINKEPASERLFLTKNGLHGDGQGDLVHHGGEDKAVCVYSLEHFPYWESAWGRPVLPGAFGENFTAEGLTEEQLCIGDVVRIGSALVQVSQPRQPCFKLGLKHGLPELPVHVQETGYTGFYFRVLEEGEVGSGDTFMLERRDSAGITLQEANRVMHTDKKDAAGIAQVLNVAALSASWRETLSSRLAKLNAADGRS
ncbi:MOSC domain-containing protein [Paenibacillus aurantiacus]|uniref:MOSC domain-containing protein n=1 Tax=Paenibacillus aurantiacus TaxID=1936118 RepID=A0ABV5KYW1_9BACL